MAENSNIEWTDHTFNPWIGCTRVGPGCDHCYAATLMQDRWHKVTWGPGQDRKLTAHSNWMKVRHWNDRATKRGVRERVFCASLADVFDAEVSNEWRARLFDVVKATPMLDWLLLTKRPQVAQRYTALFDACSNTWLGVSVENQAMAELRIPVALVTSPRVFLSVEPLLEAIRFDELLDGIDWVIVGGESGPGYRPMDLKWPRSIYYECIEWCVPFFFKQTAGKGEIPPDLMIRETPW